MCSVPMCVFSVRWRNDIFLGEFGDSCSSVACVRRWLSVLVETLRQFQMLLLQFLVGCTLAGDEGEQGWQVSLAEDVAAVEVDGIAFAAVLVDGEIVEQVAGVGDGSLFDAHD